MDLIHHLVSTSGQDFSQRGTHEVDDGCEDSFKVMLVISSTRAEADADDGYHADADADDDDHNQDDADDDNYDDAVVDGTVDDL